MPKAPISERLFQEAQQIIPGGVNSPVRACSKVGSTPRFVKRGLGARIYDEDGNEYLDFVSSWGPLIFGHRPPSVREAVIKALEGGTSFGAPTASETRLARLINKAMPSMEKIRLVSSGTEAAMSAIRLARGATGRDILVKFQGCYHGHADSLLVAAGSGLTTYGIPDSLGVPKALAELTMVAPYNDIGRLEEIFRRSGSRIAAVIAEPVAGNMGLVLPQEGFLKTIESLCRQYGALFICDEVITGFRLGLSGAQGFYGLSPDLTILGKIIGGGLPLAAFGGRRELMDLLAPLGGIYQAGTLSGNPLAVAAGIAAIERLQDEKGLYGRLRYMSERWASGLFELAKAKGLPSCSNQLGSMSTLFFTEGPVTDFASASKSDTDLYGAFWRGMLEEGLWLAPSQFELTFISAGFLFDEIDLALEKAEKVFSRL